MMLNIDDVRDISKLFGMIRLVVTGEYKVARELLDELLPRLQRYAKQHRISIEIISPTGERLIAFTAGGILLGALFGFYFGQLPGALAGVVIGGIAGFCGAHTTLVMNDRLEGDFISFTIA